MATIGGYMPSVHADLPKPIRKRLNPTERYGVRITLVAFAVILVVVPFATLVFEVLGRGPLTRLDGSVANHLNDLVHESPVAVTVLRVISWLGRPISLYVFVGVAVVVMWRSHQRKLVAFLIVTALGGGIVDTVVKLLVNRPRPVVDHPVQTALGKSFPSGHAMSSLICYGVLVLIFLPALQSTRARRAALIGTAALVLAIGLSRLMLGVHFLTDVIGGYVLGAAWLAGSVAAFEVWRIERGKRRSEPLEEGVEPEAGPAIRAGVGA